MPLMLVEPRRGGKDYATSRLAGSVSREMRIVQASLKCKNFNGVFLGWAAASKDGSSSQPGIMLE
jgi:hypothetical protein